MESALAPALDALASATHAVGSSGGLTAPVAALAACAAAAGAAERALRDGAHPRAALAPVDASIAAAVADARAGGDGADATRQAGPRAALAVAAPAFACFGTSDPAGTVSDARAYTSRRLAAVRTANEHPAHARWADALDSLLVDLLEYVKATYPAGVRNGAGPQAPHRKQAPNARAAPYRSAAPPAAAATACAATSRAASAHPDSSHARAPAAPQKAPTTWSSPSPPTRAVTSSSSQFCTASANTSGTAPHIADYEQNVLGGDSTTSFLAAARALGGPIHQQADRVVDALRALGEFLRVAATTQKPASPEKLQALLIPVGTAIGQVAAVADETSPRDPMFNHLTAVAESIPMLGWVAAESKPISAVSDAESAGEFYLSKALMAAKKLNNAGQHQEYIGAYRGIVAAMKAYIKEHHTMALRWNLGLEGPAAAANTAYASRGLRDMRNKADDNYDDRDDTGDSCADDSVTAFKAIIKGSLIAYISASKALGSDCATQAEAFAEVWHAEESFLVKAVTMPKPVEPDFSSIADKMGKVSDIAQAYAPRGPHVNHLTAVAESVAALGWVAVDSGSTSFISDQAAAGQFYVDKVKMAAKRSDNCATHLAWASALEALFSDLKAYVKEYHAMSLQWNSVTASKSRRNVSGASRPLGASSYRNTRANGDEAVTDAYVDPVSAFKVIVNGPVRRFVDASAAISRELRNQADAFADVWKAEENFIVQSATTVKPSDPDFSPIASKMGKVSEIAQAYEPRGPLVNHFTAVSESVGTLGWVAVESGATSFVSDQSSAGQFYIDKVKMAAKRSDKPECHLTWAEALENIFTALKAYVKEYHTNALQWNFSAATARRGRAGAVTRGPTIRTQSNGHSMRDDSVESSLSVFADLVSGPVKTCVDSGVALGGGVALQCLDMLNAFKAEYAMLVKVASQKRPTDLVLSQLTAPIAESMGKVANAAADTAPREASYNLMTAIAESIPALGWVAVDESPKDYISGFVDAGSFYSSKALMSARTEPADRLAKTQAFVRNLKDMYAGLTAFVVKYQANGLEWNSGLRPPSHVPF